MAKARRTGGKHFRVKVAIVKILQKENDLVVPEIQVRLKDIHPNFTGSGVQLGQILNQIRGVSKNGTRKIPMPNGETGSYAVWSLTNIEKFNDWVAQKHIPQGWD